MRPGNQNVELRGFLIEMDCGGFVFGMFETMSLFEQQKIGQPKGGFMLLCSKK